jgi:hypothetical protein
MYSFERLCAMIGALHRASGLPVFAYTVMGCKKLAIHSALVPTISSRPSLFSLSLALAVICRAHFVISILRGSSHVDLPH